jgi:preprotein translocase subunit YajC
MLTTFLILLAEAQAPGAGDAKPGGGGMWNMVILLGILGLIFYFMVIKPQKNQKKKHADMVSTLKAGDEIVTIGGIHGTIFAVKKGTFVMKVDEKSKIEMSMGSIARLKGDGEDADAEDNELKK